MRFLSGHGVRLPRGFAVAAERALATGFKQALEAPRSPTSRRMRAILEEAGRAGITLHEDGLGLALEQTLARLVGRLAAQARRRRAASRRSRASSTLAKSLPFEVDFGKAQNAYYELAAHGPAGDAPRRPTEGRRRAAQWVERFRALGEKLAVRVGAPTRR